MQNIITLILNTQKNSYNTFFDFLNNKLSKISFYSQADNLLSDVSSLFANSCSKEDDLFVFFIEYPYLKYISEYLASNIDPLNYILISFSDSETPSNFQFENVFELINLNSNYFNNSFFYNRLIREVNTRTRISVLQSEVKEFYEIGKSLSSEKDTLKLFEMIINSSMKLTSSDAGTLYLVVDKSTESWSSIEDNSCKDKMLKFVIAKNISIDIDLETSLTPITKESIYGFTALTGKSIKIDDAYNIDSNLQYTHNHYFDLLTGYKTKSILSIPMKDNDNNITGVIQLINKKRQRYLKIDYSNESSLNNIIPYDFSDELIMNSLASQAAVILTNNLLYNDMQKLLEEYKQQNQHLSFLTQKILKSNEDERKRIAREIHDGPAQYSSNSLLRVELCKKYFQKSDFKSLENELNNLGKSLRDTIKETRTIIYDLKPSYLESGLFKSIKNHSNDFRQRTGIEATVTYNGIDSDIEDYMVSALYRIVQESLTNVYKHAKADKVKLNISVDNNQVLLIISDNGVGFDINKINKSKIKKSKSGFGLEGIKERVELLRGRMSITSERGLGTDIVIKVPL